MMTKNLSLIKYYWQSGVYTQEKMVTLVQEGILSEQEFFNITSYNYKGVVQSLKRKQK